MWYPFTVCISDVSVYVAANLAFLFLFYYLLTGGDQKVSLQIVNVFLEFITVGSFLRQLGRSNRQCTTSQ